MRLVSHCKYRSITFFLSTNQLVKKYIYKTKVVHITQMFNCYNQQFLISILPPGAPKSARPISSSESAFYPHQSANQQISILPLPHYFQYSLKMLRKVILKSLCPPCKQHGRLRMWSNRAQLLATCQFP